MEVFFMPYNVYSLPDVKSTIYHPDVGTANLHEYGIGKITISSAGDYASHTTTSDGYVIVKYAKRIDRPLGFVAHVGVH